MENKPNFNQGEDVMYSPEELKIFRKIGPLFLDSTLNSDNLSGYRMSELPYAEVMKRIENLGFLNTFKKIQKNFLNEELYKNDQYGGKEVDSERLARVLLKVSEENNQQ
ncbi:MAG TPA: hypothetical protein VFQ59_01440 [Candidatus Paceibacterota bacterium]|nr:hypothetical protein [Candidatus Paceibacterota bacterium]